MIQRKIDSLYGVDVKLTEHVTNWLRKYDFGRGEIHCELRSGQISLVKDKLGLKIEDLLQFFNHHKILDALHELLLKIHSNSLLEQKKSSAHQISAKRTINQCYKIVGDFTEPYKTNAVGC